MGSKTRRAPFHPGEILLNEYLIPRRLSQKEFAQHLGWTYARLNEIINMRRGVTADSALSFAEALDMDPMFWLNLQCDWDLWQAEQTHVTVKRLAFKKKGQ